MGSSARRLKSLRSFVLHTLQALDDAAPGFGRQTAGRQMVRVFVEARRGFMEKPQFIFAAAVRRIRVETFFIVPSRSEPSHGSKRKRLATGESDDTEEPYKQKLPSACEET